MDMNYTFVFLSARTFPWLGARFAFFKTLWRALFRKLQFMLVSVISGTTLWQR